MLLHRCLSQIQWTWAKLVLSTFIQWNVLFSGISHKRKLCSDQNLVYKCVQNVCSKKGSFTVKTHLFPQKREKKVEVRPAHTTKCSICWYIHTYMAIHSCDKSQPTLLYYSLYIHYYMMLIMILVHWHSNRSGNHSNIMCQSQPHDVMSMTTK